MQVDLKARDERIARARELEAEKAHQREIETATSGLPEDAAWVVQKVRSNAWPDNGAFLADAETYLGGREMLSSEGYAKLSEANGAPLARHHGQPGCR